MIRISCAATLAICLLSACNGLSARVEKGLIRAGLNPRTAACMAPRLADELSITQLRRLQDLGGVAMRTAAPLQLDRFLHQVRALRDPEIIGVTTRAALACALG